MGKCYVAIVLPVCMMKPCGKLALGKLPHMVCELLEKCVAQCLEGILLILVVDQE